MNKISSSDSSTHLHSTTEVTSSRLEHFAVAPRDVQRQVLAVLRERTVDDNIGLALAAVVFTIIVPIANLTVLPTPGNVIVRFIAVTIGVLLLTVVIATVIGWTPIRHHRRRQLATVWLAAYEDELQRRHRQKGRSARKWQSQH